MKIKIIKYINGGARIVLEEYPTMTFCHKLTPTTTQQEIIDDIKAKVDVLKANAMAEEKFNNLNLKNLEGTDI